MHIGLIAVDSTFPNLALMKSVDPYDDHYKHRRNAIIYAWEHNMSYREALAALRKNK